MDNIYNVPLKCITLMILAFCSNRVVAQTSVDTSVQRELDSINARFYSKTMIAVGPGSSQEIREKIRSIDSLNVSQLAGIIQSHGYPGKRMVGPRRSGIAMMILYLSNAYEPYEPLFQEAMKNGDIAPAFADRFVESN